MIELAFWHLRNYTVLQCKLSDGDITEERVDAIVNAPNNQLQNIGGVAKQIENAAGEDFTKECRDWIKENSLVLCGCAVTTTAGLLPCKKVYQCRWTHLAKHRNRTRAASESSFVRPVRSGQ